MVVIRAETIHWTLIDAMMSEAILRHQHGLLFARTQSCALSNDVLDRLNNKFRLIALNVMAALFRLSSSPYFDRLARSFWRTWKTASDCLAIGLSGGNLGVANLDVGVDENSIG